MSGRRVGDVVLVPLPIVRVRARGAVRGFSVYDAAGDQLGVVWMGECTPRWIVEPIDARLRPTVCRTRAEACAYLSGQPTNGH